MNERKKERKTKAKKWDLREKKEKKRRASTRQENNWPLKGKWRGVQGDFRSSQSGQMAAACP